MTAGVAAGHPSTVEAGIQLLAQGGNAADAAAGAILASCVAETVLTGLGGGGFASYYEARTGRLTCLDFFCDLPGKATGGSAGMVPAQIMFDGIPLDFSIGAASIAVPGTPAGVWELHRRWGQLPWTEVITPAIELARVGAPLPAAHSTTLAALAPAMLPGEGASTYAPAGRLLQGGELLYHPGLAQTLCLLAERGPRPFYTGGVARQIVEAVHDGGGCLGLADLGGYRVVERPVDLVTFAEHQVLGRCDLSRTLATLAALAPLPKLPVGERATAIASALVAHGPQRFGSTTNLAVLDERGNACVATTTLGIGSGVWVPGTGVHLNSMLGEAELADPTRGPGDRLPSNMCPLVVLGSRGEVVLGLGAAGSSRIRSALVHTLVNVLVRKMGVAEAIAHPRFHVLGATQGRQVVQVEPGYPEVELGAVTAAGYQVRRWPRLSHYFGGVSAAGAAGAAGDPRRGGTASRL